MYVKLFPTKLTHESNVLLTVFSLLGLIYELAKWPEQVREMVKFSWKYPERMRRVWPSRLTEHLVSDLLAWSAKVEESSHTHTRFNVNFLGKKFFNCVCVCVCHQHFFWNCKNKMWEKLIWIFKVQLVSRPRLIISSVIKTKQKTKKKNFCDSHHRHQLIVSHAPALAGLLNQTSSPAHTNSHKM